MDGLRKFIKGRWVVVACAAAIIAAAVLIFLFARLLCIQTEYRDARAELANVLSSGYGDAYLQRGDDIVPAKERDVRYYLQYVQSNSTTCYDFGPKTISDDAIKLVLSQATIAFTPDEDGISGVVQWEANGKQYSYRTRGLVDFTHLVRYYENALLNKDKYTQGEG